MLHVLALLIGFKYQDLNGTIIDLYHAHKWCESFNCDIHVITDITDDGIDLGLAIKQEIVDQDVTTFYNRIASKYIVQNKIQFSSSINKILNIQHITKLVVYYTGHGVQNGIKLPDENHMSFNDFRDNVIKNVNENVEIFWILDCCNPSNLSLPYQLKNNQFIFQNDSTFFGPHRILLITSANSNEKSITTKTGSLFTRYLFKILSNMPVTSFDVKKPLSLIHNRNLQRLIGNLSSAIRTVHSGYQQTVSIYTSYIQDPVLWMWIGSTKSYNITGNYINNHPVIIIKRNI